MTSEERPGAASFGLPPEQFAAAFPFHIVTDRRLTILQVGASLGRICPDIRPGARLDAVVGAVRPEGQIGYDWIVAHAARFFLLEHSANGLKLRGQFLVLPNDGTLLFLGSPWFTDTAQIPAHGLRFDDFAIHDPVVDLLQVFQASKMGLADANRLAAKLTAQRGELRAANERLRQQEAEARRLALVAARTDNAVLLSDAAGRIQWANEGFTRISGYSLDEVVGRTPGSVLQGPRTNPATVQRMRERLRCGEGFTEEILNYRKDGRAYWIAVEVQPLRDEAGRITNFMAIESDITDRRAAQQRLAIQFEVSTVLAEAGDELVALQRILQVICEHLDWTLGQFWLPANEEIASVGAWKAEDSEVGEFVEASRATRLACGQGLIGRVWQEGRPIWVPDVSRDRDFVRAEAAARVGLRTGIALPVTVRGQTWGVLEFFSTQAERHDSALLETFEAVGRQVGQFVARRDTERALREEKELLEQAHLRELATGHEIQRTLLIGDPPAGVHGADIAGYAEPSQGIDGDFFAFTAYRSDCMDLLVGDVMGKGVPAALIGAAVRTAYNQTVTALMATSLRSGVLPSPADVVDALHRRLTPRLIELETFVTLALYRFDLASGRVDFVNAGHTAGLLQRLDGQVAEILGDNLPLGVRADERYVDESLTLLPGEALLAYSDGITEARNGRGEAFGDERLRSFLADVAHARLPAAVALQALRSTMRDFGLRRDTGDDRTAVIVSRTPTTAPGTEQFELPWHLRALSELRHRVARAAQPLGDAAADGLVLAANEVVTNVLRHVPQPFPDSTLTCRIASVAGRVTVDLWHIGPPFRPPAELVPDFSGRSEGGFGLYIVHNAVAGVRYDNPFANVCRTTLVQTTEALGRH
jgi:PAS domain S-box-containing protein